MTNILDILKLTEEEKESGVWLSGIEGEGEFKKWYRNGQIWRHSNWKDGERHGEYKEWWLEGGLFSHSHWKKGEKHGESKLWNVNGMLIDTPFGKMEK